MTSPTQTVGTRPAIEIENTRLAVDFLKSAGSGKAVEAMRRHAAADFVHHNPFFESDGETLAQAMDDDNRAKPGKVLDVQRTIADGPLVAVHSRVSWPAGREVAAVHIFRIEDGMIRELWDVAQEVPADSPNQAGMF
jgi:predicted SnoaL-like aldol condensation-catalyzing enzyme